MEQQGCGISVKHGGWFGADGHQGIGEQQAARGPVQTGHLHEGAEAEIEGAQAAPVEFIAMGQSLLKQNPSAAGWESQPTRGQREREAPLAGSHPHRGIGEGPSQGWGGQLVLQARGGGQHDRHHGAMVALQLPESRQQLRGDWQRGVEQQALAQAQHRHPDRHRHVEDPLQLLKGPHLAGDQFAHQGAPPSVGIERQQRPPGPALLAGITGLGGSERGQAGGHHAKSRKQLPGLSPGAPD